MKYTFKDIFNEELYETGLVVFVVGQYNIFNNIVIDKLKLSCEADDNFETDTGLLDEFGVGEDSKQAKIKVSNYLDFNNFMDVVGIPSINGRWYCSTDLKLLNRRQKDRLKAYMRKPNKNGVLVVVSHDWMDFKDYLRNNSLTKGTHSHIIQLGFPNKNILTNLVLRLFEQKGVKIGADSADLFVMRMSRAYDDYEEIIDRVCAGRKGKLDIKEVQDGLKGIDNYIVDDFIERLLSPISGDKITTNRRIYRMMESLLSDMGPRELVKRMKYQVNDFIDFRIAINTGLIPIKVKFSVDEAKKRIGPDNKISGIHDFRFRRMASIASQTSLKDWTYMQILLSDKTLAYSDAASERVIYTIVHRSVLGEFRLNNSLKLENTITKQLECLNSIKYTDNKHTKDGITGGE